jgi:Fuc2NAc and GlcNAc transferase
MLLPESKIQNPKSKIIYMDIITNASIDFTISLAAVFVVKKYLGKSLADIPNDRSSHTQVTPRGGGIGFIVAFAIMSLLTSETYPLPLPYFWLSLAPLIGVGILDDRFDVSSLVRYLIQLATASIIVYQLHAFPQPWFTSLGTIGIVIAVGLTIIGITAGINFYNFMDGLDGLVSGVTVVQLGFLAVWGNIPALWLLVASLLGFICWNWAPAKIFMGDAGSTFLGATIAIVLLNESDPLRAWMALTITLPLMADALYTIIRRLQRGENITQAHRKHIFQRLQQSGLSHAAVAAIYIIATAIVGILVTTLGSIGAGLSVLGVLMSIAIGELYLSRKAALPENLIPKLTNLSND